MSGVVLIVAHPRLGNALELVTAARGSVTHVAALGAVDFAALAASGVAAVHTVSEARVADGQVDAMADAVTQLARTLNAALVLIPHNPLALDLAPRIACALDGDAATGCVAVALVDDHWTCTRPRQGGIAHEVLAYPGPLVATVRAGNYAPAATDAVTPASVTAFDYTPSPAATRVTLIERRRDDAGEGPRLEDAKAIVAGGRGLEGPEGFAVLQELAAGLGAVVGASRVPCDLGWCPRSWQIGLTGRTVTPELYVAVGISGASHHMAGCGNARTIVAINTDRDAAIFRDARYGLVGDYRAIVPALIAALKQS